MKFIPTLAFVIGLLFKLFLFCFFTLFCFAFFLLVLSVVVVVIFFAASMALSVLGIIEQDPSMLIDSVVSFF